MVVLVLGLPGSGKSYFAKRLAEKIHAEYVNSDQLRKLLFSKRTYSEFEKAAVYEAMLKKMNEANAKKNNVVLDATFHKKSARALFVGNTKEKICFIEIWADESIIKERLKKVRPFSEADYEIHKQIKQEWEPLEEDHLRLKSTDKNIDDMLQRAVDYLKYDERANR
ncbi:MAG: ATP-binding protein [Pricia sp.]|nr:ATP-binding protein [Pricia sp.]